MHVVEPRVWYCTFCPYEVGYCPFVFLCMFGVCVFSRPYVVCVAVGTSVPAWDVFALSCWQLAGYFRGEGKALLLPHSFSHVNLSA